MTLWLGGCTRGAVGTVQVTHSWKVAAIPPLLTFFFSLYTKVEVILLGMLPAFPQWLLSTVLSALRGAVQSSCRVCQEPGITGPKGSMLQDREPHTASRPGLSSDLASPPRVGQDRVLPSNPLRPAQGGLLHLGPALRIAQGMPLPPHL